MLLRCAGDVRISSLSDDEVHRQRERDHGQHEVEPDAEAGLVAVRNRILSKPADDGAELQRRHHRDTGANQQQAHPPAKAKSRAATKTLAGCSPCEETVRNVRPRSRNPSARWPCAAKRARCVRRRTGLWGHRGTTLTSPIELTLEYPHAKTRLPGIAQKWPRFSEQISRFMSRLRAGCERWVYPSACGPRAGS